MMYAQSVPRGFSYQAVARDASGQLLNRRNVSVRFALRGATPQGQILYAETHSVQTDEFGLFALTIGRGTPVAGQFSAVSWTSGPIFLQVEMDASGGQNFVSMATVELLTVPFAMVADTVLRGGGAGTVSELPLTGTGTAANPFRIVPGAPGDVLVWTGTRWEGGTPPDAGWGSQTAAVQPPLAGNGTAADPIRFHAPGGQIGALTWNGTQWITQPTTVLTDPSLTGDGSSAAPLGVASQGATLGQVLKWNGTSWAPGNDDVDFGAGPLAVSSRLSGNGTPASPLDIAGQGAAVGQVLKWNGTNWAPADDQGASYLAGPGIVVNGTQISASDPVVGNEVVGATPGGGLVRSGDGTLNLPYTLGLPTAGVAPGQVMQWNGNAWVPQHLPSQNISLNGAYGLTVTPATGAVFTIGLPPGSQNGQVLRWNGNFWAPQSLPETPVYTAGNGISISGGVISQTVWTEAGGNAFRTSGRVGVGTPNPFAVLDLTEDGNFDLPHVSLFEIGADFSRLYFENAASNRFWGIFGRPASPNTVGRLNFFYSDGDQDILSLTHDGRAAVGTTDPDPNGKFHVFTGYPHAGVFQTDHASDDCAVVDAFYDGTGAFDATAVRGGALPAPGKGFGGKFYGGNIGAAGFVAQDFGNQYALIGLYGESAAVNVNTGTRIGVYGLADGGQYSVGVYGTGVGAPANRAALLEGNVEVVGFLAKSAGSFKIDHPLDPENKYLFHSFVESPDMLNVYNGLVVTDAAGKAVVELPAYFQALNKDFRYQLTAVGGPAALWVEHEVENNRFVVGSDRPNVKVSWQITGVRKDPYAETYRIHAEVDKPESERGLYLHPELYGRTQDKAFTARFRPAPAVRGGYARPATAGGKRDGGRRSESSSVPEPQTRTR
jgi:hypothetical protein